MGLYDPDDPRFRSRNNLKDWWNTAEKRVEDPLITAANTQFNNVRDDYLTGVPLLGTDREFGPNEPWTKAFRNEYSDHLNKAREGARQLAKLYCQENKEVLNKPQLHNYWLNEMSLGQNAGIFLEDMDRYAGHAFGLQRLGSFNMTWTLRKVDCCKNSADVDFDAFDSFNLHDNFRIPMSNLGPPKDPLGIYNAPFNSIYIHWYWNETIGF